LIERSRSFLWSDLPPWRMGLSAAVGAFIAVTPTVGIQTVAVVAIVSAIKGNRALALLASGIANPWTLPFIYYLDYRMGSIFTGTRTQIRVTGWITPSTAGGIFIQTLLGSIVVGIALGVAIWTVVTVFFKVRSGCRCRKSVIDIVR